MSFPFPPCEVCGNSACQSVCDRIRVGVVWYDGIWWKEYRPAGVSHHYCQEHQRQPEEIAGEDCFSLGLRQSPEYPCSTCRNLLQEFANAPA